MPSKMADKENFIFPHYFKINALNRISSAHVHIFQSSKICYIKNEYFQIQYGHQNFGFTSEQ